MVQIAHPRNLDNPLRDIAAEDPELFQQALLEMGAEAVAALLRGEATEQQLRLLRTVLGWAAEQADAWVEDEILPPDAPAAFKRAAVVLWLTPPDPGGGGETIPVVEIDQRAEIWRTRGLTGMAGPPPDPKMAKPPRQRGSQASSDKAGVCCVQRDRQIPPHYRFSNPKNFGNAFVRPDGGAR